MGESDPQKNAMDLLDAWVAQFNARARPALPLRAKGEAGGAQLRLQYTVTPDTVSIFHMVAVSRDGHAAIVVRQFEGPTAQTSVEAGLWASAQLGRRPVG